MKLKKFFHSLLVLSALSGAATSASHASFTATVGTDATVYPMTSNGYGESFFPSVGGRLSAQAAVPNFRFFVDGFARVYVSHSLPFYVNAAEAYVATTSGFAGPVTLTLGRKRVQWNTMDENFRLGIWEPRFRWDPVNPESVGLMGLFADVELGYVKLHGFASPIFMPETGVPMNFENGSIVSPSVFAMNSVSNIAVMGASVPVQYALQMPAIEKLVINPAVSLQARLGQASPPTFSTRADYDPLPQVPHVEGAWMAAGYAFKPMNQIFMMYNYGLRVETSPYVLLPIQPRIGYHHLMSIEGGYENQYLSAWVSALGEVPLFDSNPSDWTTQQAINSVAGSAHLEWRFGNAYADSPRVRLSFLKQTGGNAPDGNPPPASPMSSATGSNFEFRYPYQTALQAQVWTPLPVTSHLFLNSRFLYDIGHDGLISSLALQYLPTRDWTVGLSTDIFVTGITRYTGDAPADFIGQFQKNSRFQASVNYLF